MESFYKAAVKLILIISGDEQLRIFSLQRAILNALGFNWWKGGPNLPLPEFLKHTVFQVVSLSILIHSCTFTIKASSEMETNTPFRYMVKMNGIILMIPFIVSVIKMFYLMWMKNDFIYLFETCENLENLSVDEDPIKFGIRSCFLYTQLLYLTAGTWTAYFVVLLRELPFVTDYPWSQDNRIGWLSALGGEFFCGVYTCSVNALLDTIFPMAISAVDGTLDQLMKKLKKLGQGPAQDNVLIYEAVEVHNKILRVSDVIKKCFNEVFVAQSMYTVLHACVLIFAVAKAQDKFGAIMSSFPLLLCSYAQLWMYCSFGQTLTDKFDQLTFASYNNRWYLSSINSRKAMVLFAEACKRPVSVRGFGSITASVANFLHKIQDSISYYLILKTITAGTGPDKDV